MSKLYRLGPLLRRSSSDDEAITLASPILIALRHAGDRSGDS
ncbi:MAG: hypothetical protein ACRDK3_11550 [Actinomycetota bacterium]